jgi:ribosomal protein L40E
VDAIVEPEPGPVAVDAIVEPEPGPVAVDAIVEPEPEPAAVASVVEPEPEPVAVASVVEPEPEPVAADDIVPQPMWPAAAGTEAPAAPEAPVTPAAAPAAPVEANPWLTVAPDEPDAAGSPQWPANPQWGLRQPRRDAPTTLAGRPLLPQDDAAALWAASAQEVLGGGPRPTAPVAAVAQATPQPCVSCGLPLSTNARFCRRCGTRQG